MNSYLLTRLFYQEMEKSEALQVHCRPHHQALFFRIIQIQNQVGWQVKTIGLPTENTMFFTCIGSYKTYKKCLHDLITWGLIEEISPAKNQHQARQISLHTAKWTAFFTEASRDQLPEQDQRTAEATANTGPTHCRDTDQRTAKASPPYKTTKLVKEETSKPLNLETFKHTYLAERPKSTGDEISSLPEINFSSKENTAHRFTDESPTQQEKKNVAPKRKDNSTKPKESLAKANDKPDLLFKNSPYADKLTFMAAFAGSDYEGANLEYYYEIVNNWSESKQAKKKDWIATVKNWMLRDYKEGKLVTQHATNYGNSQFRETAGQNSYTELGNAVDRYFERKFGK